MSIYGTNSATAFNNTYGGTLTDLTLLSEIVVREHTAVGQLPATLNGSGL